MGSPSHPQRILIVEDDDTIGRNLQAGLRAHGYDTTWQRTGAGALAEAAATDVDVVLLDLTLPDLDGVDIARDLRHRHPRLLIVMLTARGEDIDVVVGLDVGADDYLIKPVSLTVLLARLRTHLRRRAEIAHTGSDVHADAQAQPVVIGVLTLDAEARRCRLAGLEVGLRPKEFDLLAYLAARAGTAVRREDLMSAVWDEHWFGSTKTLDVTMAATRRALQRAADRAGTADHHRPVITTLRGHGYRLERPDPTSADSDPARR